MIQKIGDDLYKRFCLDSQWQIGNVNGLDAYLRRRTRNEWRRQNGILLVTAAAHLIIRTSAASNRVVRTSCEICNSHSADSVDPERRIDRMFSNTLRFLNCICT